MVSKNLLSNSKPLRILIDSESFNEELNQGNDDIDRILKYSKSELLDFCRSVSATEFKELNLIQEVKETCDRNGNLISIGIKNDSLYSKMTFDYPLNYIKSVGVKLSNKNSLKRHDINVLILFFVHASINPYNPENTQILITNNEFLLKNRLLLYQYTNLSEDVINHRQILTIKESQELIGLFLKYQNKYLISANPFSNTQYKCNQGYWYWCSFRSKIPCFHVGAGEEPYLDAFANRFVYLLRSIDEIGFQYYMETNNDTMNNMMYHFNYSISLITGIFDALALVTKNKYKLQFEKDYKPERTSLNPAAGKDFLRTLRKENQDLRDHIENYVNVIKLIYELREVVIHRELLEKRRVPFGGMLEMNAVLLNPLVLKYLPKNDKKQEYNSISKWGLFRQANGSVYLEPFNFSKNLLKTMVGFSNEYLRLLGYGSFLEEQLNKNSEDNFSREIELFENDTLDII